MQCFRYLKSSATLVVWAATAGLAKGAYFLWLIAALGGPQAHALEPWTLEAALAKAGSDNPDAVSADYRIALSEAVLQQANSVFWPQLRAQSAWMRTNNPAMVFGSVLNQKAFSSSLDFNDVPTADNLNLKGSIMMPLFSGGRNSAGREAALALQEAARYEAQAVRSVLGLEVAKAFFTILKAREFIKTAEAAVEAYSGNLTAARKRLEQGAALETEVLDVEVQLARAREDRIRAYNGASLAERALGSLLGIEEAESKIADRWPELEPVPKDAEVKRPELQAMRSILQAAEAKVRAARAGYLPEVNAFASADYNRGWELDGEGASYTGGVEAQWSIWDGFRTKGAVAQAQAELNVAREQERKLRLGIALEIEQARLNLNEAGQRLEVCKTALTEAEQSAELTRLRFNQGLSLSTQLIDAETALIGSKVRLAEARADEHIAISAIRKALGLPILD